ncbi:MAG: 6-bladed beta-propeller [Ectothiorhodospiraceae bacterium]|nr:6-bladed beta-propeller [Chromatiales bacterium]MCP5154592.1 6-bladed beta-propeller [Ectothiorhodospiraceae bacterium]
MVSALRVRLAHTTAALVVATMLAGCAEPERELRLDAAVPATGAALVWPPSPEVPRYLYAGQLTGEDNLREVGGQGREGAAALLAWIVGLGQSRDAPVVLQRPQSGAVDGAGRVYVTDVSHQAVFVFDEPAARMLVWHEAEPGVRFVAPIGVLPLPSGDVLVTDAELGAVFRFGHDGESRGRFGDDVLTRPTGIARDPERRLVFVADTRENDIKVFDETGVLVDYIGRHGKAVGELNAPTHIAWSRGRLYVSDTLNSRVQVFDREGAVVEHFGERGLYVGNLTRPKGIAVDDEGNIYVVESYYDYLLVYDAEGRLLLPIGGTGKAPGQFYLPAGVWTDARSRVYVADMFNGRVSIFQFLGGS